jgi:glycine cleavage system protein P-like pyridoxal-binding family
VTTLDFAKAMIDEGFHPMTMYFPLVVHGAMLIEPTETESKAEIDRFCEALLRLAEAAKAGDAERFKAAPGSPLPKEREIVSSSRRACSGVIHSAARSSRFFPGTAAVGRISTRPFRVFNISRA